MADIANPSSVIPAKAGIHLTLQTSLHPYLDPRLRGDDEIAVRSA